jgi:thiol-disulfide isomerase/thioredoxin
MFDAAGGAHALAEFAGRGVVLNLWATWCVPCVAELPSLAALAARLASAGVVVVPLSSDRGGAAVVQKFYAGHAIAGLDVWLDPKGAAASALRARGLPTTLLIDRQGRERGRLEGGADWASDAAVAGILRVIG